MDETLSGSITLKRLKKGVNVVLSIETENAALYQGWNDKTSIPEIGRASCRERV